MAWAADYRQTWIADMLQVYGFVGPKHVIRKFSVSNDTAYEDFLRFKRENPGAIVYDKSIKSYKATTKPARTWKSNYE